MGEPVMTPKGGSVPSRRSPSLSTTVFGRRQLMALNGKSGRSARSPSGVLWRLPSCALSDQGMIDCPSGMVDERQTDAFERDHGHRKWCGAAVVELNHLGKQDACGRGPLFLLGAKRPQREVWRWGSAVDEPREVFRLPVSDDPVLADLGVLVHSEWMGSEEKDLREPQPHGGPFVRLCISDPGVWRQPPDDLLRLCRSGYRASHYNSDKPVRASVGARRNVEARHHG